MPTRFIEGEIKETCMSQEEEVDLGRWWEQFNDPLLTELIIKSLNCNYDLRIARERICEARAVYGIDFSVLLPHVDGGALFSRIRNSQTLSDSLFTGGTFVNYYRAGFDTFWELDLFGKNIDRTRAAAYEVAASIEHVRDVHVSIASEVAMTYFMIRTLQDRIDIAERHIEIEIGILELVEDRFQAGLISALDVYLSKALLKGREAIVPELEIKLHQTIYSLAVLLGTPPEALAHTFCNQEPLPCSEGKIPLGLPSDLLCRRGDVRQAEFAMLASGARVLSARKEFFPTISLEAFYTYATGFFNRWGRSESRQWHFSPSLILPIFHGGEILSNIDAVTSLQRQAVLEYEQIVLKALEETESALVSYFHEGARIAALKEEVEAYREARELARILYISGVVDYLYLLESEKDLYISENFLAESKEQLMTSLVAIYKALGGGWECYDLP